MIFVATLEISKNSFVSFKPIKRQEFIAYWEQFGKNESAKDTENREQQVLIQFAIFVDVV